jgi:hypothetical protein
MHHEQLHGGCGFTAHERRSSSASGKGTHDNHDLHPHSFLRKFCSDFRISVSQALSSVSTRKAITLCQSSEPSFYQASTVRDGGKNAHLVEGIQGRGSVVSCAQQTL